MLDNTANCSRTETLKFACVAQTTNRRCHPDDPHHLGVRCSEPCPRLLQPCEHPCQRYDQAAYQTDEVIELYSLRVGLTHVFTQGRGA